MKIGMDIDISAVYIELNSGDISVSEEFDVIGARALADQLNSTADVLENLQTTRMDSFERPKTTV